MRPGLDKPGALPLLALIVFSLLTLVPSLSSIYNIKFTDFTYYARGVHQVPLIQDSAVEFSADTPLSDSRKSWIVAAQHRPRGNRSPRPSSRLGNGAPAVAGETAPVENKSRLSYAAAESSILFSRRARAFRAYFTQQLDEYQLLAPFSNRSLAPEAANLDSVTSTSNPLPPTNPLGGSSSDTTPVSHNESALSYTASADNLGLQFPSTSDIWQQACQRAVDILEWTRDTLYVFPFQSIMQLASHCLQTIFPAHNTTSIPRPQDPQSRRESNSGSETFAPVDKSHKMLSDGSTDAAGRHSSELRGSCMAVVIGLVAGIIWF
ncbi:uncharacterized protein N7459_003366 [Penicillium hispanicum]|uniref:uncharacterized protein n=1 Tax=Penicillium hispanicum TaxID=1080232 RepID=UPI0025406730|nr:uncharacterized protein N7459_003366 [Penicillium hispanicum]KAJ5587601.1 hypothetical protein N7459_003366 [Penicillium hispanicum]